MLIERKDLEVGKEYYMDDRKTLSGVFKGREGDSIFFDCGDQKDYSTSRKEGKKNFVPFWDEGDGFYEVEIK